MSLHNFSEYPRPFVSVSEEKSEAQQAFCYVKSISLFLRVGRFVDANEEESECKLCERVGFVRVSIISLILPVCRTPPQRFAKLSLHVSIFQTPVSGTETPSVVASKAPYLVLSVLFLYPFLCAFLEVVLS